MIGARAVTRSLFWPHLLVLAVQLVLYGALSLWLVHTGIANIRREGLVRVPPA